MAYEELLKLVLGGGAALGVVGALINQTFTFFNNRRGAAEGEHKAKIDWLLNQADKIREECSATIKEYHDKGETSINGVRSSFENKIDAMTLSHREELLQLRTEASHERQEIRMEASAQKVSFDMQLASQEREITRLIKERGDDQLNAERRLHAVEVTMMGDRNRMEKEKVAFMEKVLDHVRGFYTDATPATGKERMENDLTNLINDSRTNDTDARARDELHFPAGPEAEVGAGDVLAPDPDADRLHADDPGGGEEPVAG